MSIADHPNVLPDLVLIDIAIVLYGYQELRAKKSLY